MKLIILAAGEGKRLRPYTNNIPKCMVELAGDSLLSHQLSTISKCNISKENIALVGGYKFEALEKFNLKIYENTNFLSTNMVTTLFCAREFMSPEEDLIISYGDIIYEEKVLKTLLAGNDDICIAADKDWERLWRLRMVNPLDDAETFIMDSNLYIKELGKKPVTYSQVQAQYMGLIKVRRDIVTRLINIYDQIDRDAIYDGQNFDNMYMTSFIQLLINLNWQVKAKLVSNGWLEIDTVDDLDCYNQMANDGSLKSYCKI